MDNTFVNSSVDFFQKLFFVLSRVETVVFLGERKLPNFVLFLTTFIKEILDTLKVLLRTEIPTRV